MFAEILCSLKCFGLLLFCFVFCVRACVCVYTSYTFNYAQGVCARLSESVCVCVYSFCTFHINYLFCFTLLSCALFLIEIKLKKKLKSGQRKTNKVCSTKMEKERGRCRGSGEGRGSVGDSGWERGFKDALCYRKEKSRLI